MYCVQIDTYLNGMKSWGRISIVAFMRLVNTFNLVRTILGSFMLMWKVYMNCSESLKCEGHVDFFEIVEHIHIGEEHYCHGALHVVEDLLS